MIEPQRLAAIRLRDSRYRAGTLNRAPTRAEIPVNDRRDLLAALDETLATLAVAQAENARLRDRLERHAFLNDGCVPKPAYDDLAAEHRRLASAIRELCQPPKSGGWPLLSARDVLAILDDDRRSDGEE